MTSKVTAAAAPPASVPPTAATAAVARRRRDSSDDFGAAGSLGSIGGSEVGSSVASGTGITPHLPLSPPPVAAVAIDASTTTNTAAAAAAASAAPTATAADSTSTPMKPPSTARAVDATPTTKNTAKHRDNHGGGGGTTTSNSGAGEEEEDVKTRKPAASDTIPHAETATATTTILVAAAAAAAAAAAVAVAATSSSISSSPPLSRRPFRKRKGSVDFTLNFDDDTSNIMPAPDTPTGNDSVTKSLILRSTMDALPSVDALPSILDPHGGSSTSTKSFIRPRKQPQSKQHRSDSASSSASVALGGAAAAAGRVRSGSLERLDALGEEAKAAAARIRGDSIAINSNNSNISHTSLLFSSSRKESISSNSKESHGTFTSQSHRMLLEAFMGGDDEEHHHDDNQDNEDDDEDMDDHDPEDHNDNGNDDNESLVDSQAAEEAETNAMVQRQERLGSFDVRDRLGSFDVRDRLGSFDVRERLGSFDVRERLGSFDAAAVAPLRDRLGSFDATHDRIESFGVRRERLESWGGMSDLSIPVPDSTGMDSLIRGGGGGSNPTVALAADIYSSLANDLAAAANPGDESISSFLVSDEMIPTKINMTRDRLNSINSNATDPSISQLPTEDIFPSDIQKFVKAAMASVGTQLAEIAAEATEAARDREDQSELSSTASPMIGAVSDTGARPRSSSLTAAMDIAVDYDAVAAAVNAAEAAAAAVDLTTFAHKASASVCSSTSSKLGLKRKRPKLPTKNTKKAKTTPTATKNSASTKETPKRPLHLELPPIPKSKMDERDMEIIRERARAAAGYVPPSKQNGERPPVPPKKKTKLEYPNTPNVKPSAGYATPRTTNSALSHRSVMSTPYTPALSTPGSCKTTASKGQSSQKWDSMYECLLEFVQDRKKEDFVGLSDQEKKDWVWDGNVPTTYKTKDGKALGRWVNNQRSAKSKGVLKGDREKRLVDAGLKWSVLASNSWNEMLEELRIYVTEYTKNGRKWDGNGKSCILVRLAFTRSSLTCCCLPLIAIVPTNYRIKTKLGAVAREDEDKNLGRWVNRQRSLYQAGKLRKDRQVVRCRRTSWFQSCSMN
jgi:hypothetical protein